MNRNPLCKQEIYESVKETFKHFTSDKTDIWKTSGKKALGFITFYDDDNQFVFQSGWAYTDRPSKYPKTRVFLTVPYEKAIMFNEKDYDNYVNQAIYELKKLKIQNRIDDLQKDFKNPVII
jgi:hypothetical protein